jgi:hypothetical protein
MNDFKKYLPSKNFISIFLFIVVLIVLFFTIKGVVSLFKNKEGGSILEPTTMTVGDIVQKDTNKNGIADWEEGLWGLDPTKNGPENKDFILAKKGSLEKNGLIYTGDDSKMITQNELLSRQFFATILSLQQTGNLDSDAVDAISSSIGEEIKSTLIPDIYNTEMAIIRNTTDESKEAYLIAFSNLVDKYEGRDIGSEMTIFAQGIANNDPQALYAAKTVADAYREFGADLMLLPVPNSAIYTHTSLANNYEKVAQSIEGLTQVLDDPIIGMRSLLNYKKYTDALVSDFEKLSDILQ